MERYELNDKDKELIKIGLDVLAANFDDGYTITRLDVLFYVKTETSIKVSIVTGFMVPVQSILQWESLFQQVKESLIPSWRFMKNT